MQMTRQHFVLIAETISQLNIDKETKAEVALAFCDKLAATNKKFNTTLFTVACINNNALNSIKTNEHDVAQPLFNKEQTRYKTTSLL